MKSALACLLMVALGATSSVLAQLPAARSRPPAPLRAPNVPNMPGTDSGQGLPCDQLTRYGQVPPQAPPTPPYGLGAPPPPPVPATVAYGTAAPARADSTLGASGIAARHSYVSDAPQLPYAFVDPPHPPGGTPTFANVNGVGLLKNGRLIVTQRMPMFQIMEYAPDGRLLRAIDPNLVGRPHGMRIDKDDNIWLTDQQCHIVVKLRPTGEVLMTLGTPGKAGMWDEAKGDHLFNQPTDVGFAPNGDVFVTSGHGAGDPSVVRFDRNGRFITAWSMKRDDPSQAIIHTVVVNDKGEVFVGDRELHLIKVFDANGKLLRQIQMKNLICGLYIDRKNQLWMTTGMDGTLLRLDWNGKILGTIGQEGFGRNGFGEAHYMTMTPDGKTIYIGDTVNNDIKKLERTN